jgi:aspartate aminotransferase
MSFFSQIELAPPDPILGLNIAFREDPSPKKVNLGVGAYRTDEGKPFILSAVAKAEKYLLESGKFDKEYLGIEGFTDFNKLCASLLFGEDFYTPNSKRLVSCQALSGTGALRLGLEFIKKFFPNGTTVYLPEPTWGNHKLMLQTVGLAGKDYRYYDRSTNSINLNGMLEDLRNAPSGSVVLLHACAHNPTGLDPTIDQWKQIAAVMKEKRHITFFDSAYQGFASGSLDKDAAAVRYFASEGFEMFVSQSFAKNMGLYGERAGCFHIVCHGEKEANCSMSQLKRIVRANYSNPPKHGAEIVYVVLSNPDLRAEWERELKMMSERINAMRVKLHQALVDRKTPGEWGHMLKQIGMFSFTGLSSDQVASLIKDYHIYMTSDGRISIAGLNSKNLDYVADSIHAVVVAQSKL